MRIVFDLDGTLCRTEGTNYEGSTPIPERIEKVNNLYAEGHEIVIWTARGSGTGIDWTELTTKQLRAWLVPYHELRVGRSGGKIPFDLFVDDKVVNADDYFSRN